MPLSPGAANVVEMPTDRSTVYGHVEDVLGNAHSLYPCMKDILCG